MAATPSKAIPQSALQVRLSSDRLRAVLWYDPARYPGAIALTDVRERLEAAGLKLDESRSADLLNQLQQQSEAGETLICEGRAPVNDTPGRIALLIAAPSEGQDDASSSSPSSNYYQRSQIISAQAGRAVARRILPVDGADGVDVCGRPLARKRAPAVQVQLGRNVEWDTDACTVKATAPGLVRLKGHLVWVDDVLEVNGNVDFATGHVDFGGDIVVGGNVVDLFKVNAGASVCVRGTVEAAEVTAKGNLIVNGGIAGRDKGRCVAGGDVVARYLSNVSVEAGGDVLVHSEIANARVVCGGKLTVERGPVLSGHMTANAGVECQSLGSPSGVKLLVEVGVDEIMRRTSAAAIPQIQAKRQQARKVKQTVEPLLRNQKNLTAQQKEKATELLYEASEIETQTAEQLARLKADYEAAQAKACAEVHVRQTLHAGVVIRFPGLETTIAAPMRGPLRVVRRHGQGQDQILAIDDGGGEVSLEHHAVPDPVLEQIKHMLAGTT